MQVFIRMTTKRDKPGWDILHQYNTIGIASDWAVYTVQNRAFFTNPGALQCETNRLKVPAVPASRYQMQYARPSASFRFEFDECLGPLNAKHSIPEGGFKGFAIAWLDPLKLRILEVLVQGYGDRV